ncbi:MAG: N-acetyltransferase [Sulfitobacter sp.]|nr:N-acetyltransferase [Sulfitobacter sp.]
MMIRPATDADAERIATLWNDIILTSLATFTTKVKSVSAVRELIQDRSEAFWVIDAEGDSDLGFVTYGPFRAGPGFAATVEHTVILGPSAQGRGYGRQLMTHALAAAAEQGHHVMVAGISSANPAAVAFHHALGFHQTGHIPEVGRKSGQWLDLILMQKTLQAP